MTTQAETRIKTAGSKKSLQTARETWLFIKDDYINGHTGKAQGKPIAWSCAAMDKELFHCMGILPFFPEQFAALCATQRRGGSRDESVEKEAVRFARVAEQEDYASYICGYQRVSTGWVIHGLRTGEWQDAPIGGMPLPDMIVTTSCVCDVRVKWFEDMAQRLNVPYFCLDRPERIFEGITQASAREHEVDYYVSQVEDFLRFAEEVTGAKYDPARLNECLDWSYKTNDARQEILELRKAVPSPMGCADGFGTMYPGMYQLGTKRCYDFYVKLRDEVRERVKQGIGQIEDEWFRLLWYGLPTWYNMSIFNYFEKYGGVFVYEPAYNPWPWPPRRREDPVRELANRWLMLGTGVGNMVNSMLHDCQQYKILGVVLSYLITCRPIVFPSLEINHTLEKSLGIPTVTLEGDLVDERLFSEAQVYNRLDAFAEQLLQRAKKR